MKPGGLLAAACAAVLACRAPPVSAEIPVAPATWSADAVRDLVAAHDLLRDNDPGAVDPADPDFRRWLDAGAAQLLPRARAARTEHDYRDVLRLYANGFADVHVFVRFDRPAPELWPGFLTRTDAIDRPTTVVLAEGATGIAVGDTLVACDGVPVRDLLGSRVLRPLTNPALPQLLPLLSPFLTIVDRSDATDRFARCRVRDPLDAARDVPLRWRPIAGAVLERDVEQASGIVVPALGLRRVGDVTLVSLPSFSWNGPDAARMRALVASLRVEAPMLHAARHVVLDLRGNEGGRSTWGDDVVAALWGERDAAAVAATLDWTVDWRVSALNRDTLRADARTAKAAGLADEANEIDALVTRMDRALAAGSPTLLHDPAPATGSALPPDLPFAHEVDVLTEPHCRSACLDFVDLLARLPGTERIGLPTAADTDDMEDAFAPLPSGRATLAIPMKVFRNRARGADVAYQPQVRWPGGVMTDSSIARFVDALPPS